MTLPNSRPPVLKYPAAKKWLKAALPALLAAGCCLANWRFSQVTAWAGADLSQLGLGSFIVAGLPGASVNWYMPLMGTVSSLFLNLGVSQFLFYLALRFGLYLLVFCAGYLLRGYWAGVISLAAAAAFSVLGNHDNEQVFYSAILLLVLLFTLLDRRRGTLKNAVLSGLSIGSSLLVRTPLFLFPPALVLCRGLFSGASPAHFIRNSLVFLAAAYVLLLPWGFLNRSLSGKFFIFDNSRAACNLVTAARGSVYTMEGDCRRAAGLKKDDSAFVFYVRETAKAPLSAALAAARRLWHIFLFQPLLFGLFIVAIAAGRDRARLFCLPVYFILIHSLLSIEERYFYPLAYLLPPLITGSLWPARGGGDRRELQAGKAAGLAFAAVFLLVLAVEALVAAYPYRAARNSSPAAFSAALARFPEDKVFSLLSCKSRLLKGDDAGFYGCLAGYSAKFDDKFIGYVLSVMASDAPAGVEIPAGHGCLTALMLREFELGHRAAAMAAFARAQAAYEKHDNMLRGAPYAKDRELAELIGRDQERFWDRYVYETLMLWTPERMHKILSAVGREIELTAKLKQLAALTGRPRTGENSGRLLRELRVTGLAGPKVPLSGPLYPGQRQLWAEDAGESKKLSDLAAEKMLAGDFKAAEKILREALAVDQKNPEALLDLCVIAARENKKEKALGLCLAAAEAARGDPRLKGLAESAQAQSRALQLALGRGGAR
ncbi:MAG: tetratricopeptide repeat protein [Elusimicrobia bacterium]|nr:tetratricopeptide repeat protein [Elusimicrobiota bacterium]